MTTATTEPTATTDAPEMPQIRPPMLEVMERNVRRRQQMFELRQQGYSLSQIGAAFGVTKQYVHYEFKRMGLKRVERQRKSA